MLSKLYISLLSTVLYLPNDFTIRQIQNLVFSSTEHIQLVNDAICSLLTNIQFVQRIFYPINSFADYIEVILTCNNVAPTELLVRKNDNYYHNNTPKGAFIELRRSDIMVENG